MIRLILLLLVLAVPARADEILLKPGEVLRGHFVQERHLEGFKAPIRSQGRFTVVPGQGLIWRAETPFAVTTVVSPAGVVQSVAGTETTRLSAARLPVLARLYDMMAGALAGDWGALERGFTVSRAGAAITLTPRGSDESAAQQISAIRARMGRYVERVEIVRPNGDFDRLTFFEQVVSASPLTADEAALLK
ncbi:outer membrane lipoprotein carrier protein LolA [Magnetospirillum sp. UT-4]|uniref:LolA family protein n=1 Tax=Magnetospirillum sp. UT-4 TaxID=2681467 RepID=UPI001384420E|nr:outer membrane lipoprotein carrier protein LolA [Magnetospirillum sp. UT-4]CAA7626550.1 conserved exported hypothetical protein [Magnetospirillum sp. UT-4]